MPLPAGVPDDCGASDASGMGSAPETDHSDADDQGPGQSNPTDGTGSSNPNTDGPGNRNSNYNADEDDDIVFIGMKNFFTMIPPKPKEYLTQKKSNHW